MRSPRLRITVRRMMVWMAIACWIAFNARLIQELLALNFASLSGATFRVVFFTAMACVIGPVVGIVTAIWSWSILIGLRRRPSWWRGFLAGALAGFAAWSSATILIGIGDSDGDIVLGVIILGTIGALVQCVPGALIGAACRWLQTRRGAEAEQLARPHT